MSTFVTDLTKAPPRSPRVKLGGYVILPRCLDKCRATLAGKNGEYHFACPLDQRFFTFTGIDPAAFKAEVAKRGSDSQMLEWVQAHSKSPRSDMEIATWSAAQLASAPSDNAARTYFNESVAAAKAEKRTDIAGWFDLLDVDDYVTFGGQA